jgi:hypothetical protein
MTNESWLDFNTNRWKPSPSPLINRVSRYGRVIAFSVLLLVTACGSVPVRTQDSVFPSPVAFVTAGPLPEPSVTPTLPPLDKPTDIPPTVVPKKLPLDSTSAIGLWSDKITSTTTFTGVVDLATGNAALELRKTNLALVGLNERQMYYGFGSTITDVLANHAGWVLYDKNGKVVVASTNGQEPLLNIRNDEVKGQLADDVSKLVQAGNYDGIVLTGVGSELIRSSSSPVFTGTKVFTDQQRRNAVESLLQTVHAKIPNKLMIIGGYAWEDGTAYGAYSTDSQYLASLGDGIYIDKFLRAPISDTATYKSEANWKKDIDYLASTSQDGKIVLITTRIDSSDATTDTVKQWLYYSVASYLLGKNGNRTYFQFDDAGTLAYANDPVLSAPIGAPQEAYTKLTSGIYRRLFSKGIVLVNPTSDKKDTDFDIEYHLLGGTDPIKKVSMSAHTGLILLKP